MSYSESGEEIVNQSVYCYFLCVSFLLSSSLSLYLSVTYCVNLQFSWESRLLCVRGYGSLMEVPDVCTRGKACHPVGARMLFRKERGSMIGTFFLFFFWLGCRKKREEELFFFFGLEIGDKSGSCICFNGWKSQEYTCLFLSVFLFYSSGIARRGEECVCFPLDFCLLVQMSGEEGKCVFVWVWAFVLWLW